MNRDRSIPDQFSKSAIIIVSLALLFLPSRVFAQVDRAVLEGTVTDPTGRVILGAKVNVIAKDTGISGELPANSNGYYRFPGLAVGTYTVTVSNTGFKTKVVEGVVLRIGQTRTLDVHATWCRSQRRCRSRRQPASRRPT